MGKLYFGDAYIRIRNATELQSELVKYRGAPNLLIVEDLAKFKGYHVRADQNGLYDEAEIEAVIAAINGQA